MRKSELAAIQRAEEDPMVPSLDGWPELGDFPWLGHDSKIPALSVWRFLSLSVAATMAY